MRIMRFQTTIRDRFQEMRGELILQIDRTDISGSLTIGERQSYLQGKVLRKNRYAAAIQLRTDIYEEDCDMLLRVRNTDSIHGSIIGEWGRWTLEGTAATEPDLQAGLAAGKNM